MHGSIASILHATYTQRALGWLWPKEFDQQLRVVLIRCSMSDMHEEDISVIWTVGLSGFVCNMPILSSACCVHLEEFHVRRCSITGQHHHPESALLQISYTIPNNRDKLFACGTFCGEVGVRNLKFGKKFL